MSEQDDWVRFLEIMAASRWEKTLITLMEQMEITGDTGLRYYWPTAPLDHYNPYTGDYGGKQVGTWREWLAAGTSPAPF